MALDPKILQSLTRRVEPADYLCVTPLARRSTPLGMGFGKTQCASPTKTLKPLYKAEDLATSIAEAPRASRETTWSIETPRGRCVTLRAEQDDRAAFHQCR